jgi:signal recognition particle receptor subunit beta
MVFFNYATMQMAAKIVYYGPGLCGKTTNLHHIYAKTSPQSRGEMVSLETETDRTLFFDLLPIDVGVIGGFKTRLQLYTIPGQVFYNTTRKLVLKGVDGIVFVADSQLAMIDANLESFKNLRDNLAEIGLNLDDIPTVVQLNKRDLPNIADIDTILGVLDPERKYEHIEASAVTGVGVFETLKEISKLTLRTLRRRMTGEEPVKAAPRKVAEVATFRVAEHSRTPTGSMPKPAIGTQLPGPSFTNAASAAASIAASAQQEVATSIEPAMIDQIVSESDLGEEEAEAFSRNVGDRILSHEPPPIAAAPPPVAAPEPEPPAAAPKADAEVKHVKVRSTVDIMAELEALRKKATQTTPKAAKKDAVAASPKREVKKSATFQAPDAAGKATSVRVALSFEGADGVIQQQERVIDLTDISDAQTVNLDLKIELE